VQHDDIPHEDSRILPFDDSTEVLEDFIVAVCIDADVRVFECQHQQSINVQENSWLNLLCSRYDLNCLGHREDAHSVVLPKN
jgi:hypothetical protein